MLLCEEEGRRSKEVLVKRRVPLFIKSNVFLIGADKSARVRLRSEQPLEHLYSWSFM